MLSSLGETARPSHVSHIVLNMVREIDERAPSVHLARVAVQELFGDRNVIIDLDSSATILTGENGSGKSTILRAVSCLRRRDWTALTDLPIGGIAVTLSDGRTVVARRGETGWILSDHNPETRPHVVRLRPDDDSDHIFGITAAQFRGVPEEDLPVPVRRRIQAEQLSFMEREREQEPDWLSSILESFNTKLISARRLEEPRKLRRRVRENREERQPSVVDVYASELTERMVQGIGLYGAATRQGERALPRRIVRAMGREVTDPAALKREVRRLQSEVLELSERLGRVGMFREEPEPIGPYESDDPKVLLAVREVYSVTKARLHRLDELLERLEVFSEFLDARYSGKVLRLNPTDGIEFELAGREGIIGPNQLSSGEQQLLVIAYQLIFDTEPNSVVLLDEPEISLHVSWLQGLVDGLIDVGRPNNLQFLIATHSTSVLAAHVNRERSLDDLTHGTP